VFYTFLIIWWRIFMFAFFASILKFPSVDDPSTLLWSQLKLNTFLIHVSQTPFWNALLNINYYYAIDYKINLKRKVFFYVIFNSFSLQITIFFFLIQSVIRYWVLSLKVPYNICTLYTYTYLLTISKWCFGNIHMNT